MSGATTTWTMKSVGVTKLNLSEKNAPSLGSNIIHPIFCTLCVRQPPRSIILARKNVWKELRCSSQHHENISFIRHHLYLMGWVHRVAFHSKISAFSTATVRCCFTSAKSTYIYFYISFSNSTSIFTHFMYWTYLNPTTFIIQSHYLRDSAWKWKFFKNTKYSAKIPKIPLN